MFCVVIEIAAISSAEIRPGPKMLRRFASSSAANAEREMLPYWMFEFRVRA